ncbi:exonuclease SbcCD subunit D [Nanchangia anserum]|uniref:Nuclease SbcCD subunit D n=1 Tax=Nanchangia anserum TaxID=2692125 RepID=A0A8I0GC51_9ACTO|nr:exonuclease SbcCD subunit D [Nanchangia anserum]MBD3690058.1 exonuclease SbcCD subunit D [Nanchangia anserum]QOX82148.1 exonuclease SbcCD subunit D [Nanchangia anserum]
MKIIHTSDWHIGRTLHGASLEEAHQAFFEALVDYVRAEEVDAVLMSGDLFDRAVPSITSLRQARVALTRLTDLARVIITTGNHDSADRLGLTDRFLNDRLVVRALPDDIDRPIDLVAEGRVHARVYTLPYLDPETTRRVLVDATGDIADPDDPDAVHQLARSHEAVIAAAARRIGAHLDAHPLEDGARVIVMAHAFFTGGLPTESERCLEVGGVEQVSAGTLTRLGKADGPVRVDYVAAGHLHRPQDVRDAGAPVRYPGSPVAFSFSEAGYEKSVTLLDTDTPDLGIRHLPLTPWRALRRIATTMEQLRAGRHEDARDSWCEVTITDDARPHNLVHEVRSLLPHTLAVFHVPAHAPTPVTAADIRRHQRSPLTLAQEFARTVGNRELNAAERDVWRDVFEKVQADHANS